MAFRLEEMDATGRRPAPLKPAKAEGLELLSVGVIVHPGRMDDLLRLLLAHGRTLAQMRVVVAGEAAGVFEDVGLPHVSVSEEEGPLAVAQGVARGELNAIIFLRDPLAARPQDANLEAMIIVCDAHRVPLATNVASAEILLMFLSDWETALIPD